MRVRVVGVLWFPRFPNRQQQLDLLRGSWRVVDLSPEPKHFFLFLEMMRHGRLYFLEF